jgi:adenosine kinase
MLRHLEQAVARGMITFFDPGQPLSAFSAEQLRHVMDMGVYLIVNTYEKELFMKIAKVSFDELVASFAGVLVTEGEQGSTLYLENEIVHVDAFPIDEIIDPTGCGDAYRGGLLR